MKRLLLLLAALLLTLPALAEPEEQAAAFAAEHLPGYAFLEGVQFDETAMLLVEDEDGRTYFAGCERDGEKWNIAMSMPFPEGRGVFMDTYHAGNGAISIGLDHPGAKPDAWGSYPYVEYAVYLQEDGRWLVESIFDYFYEWFHFEGDGLYINCTGKIYGESSLERDVTKINWAKYPLSLAEVLPTMSHDWGVISEPSLPLYADTTEQVVLAEYHCGTPVRILEEAEDQKEKGWEGHLVKVQIADSEVVGWLQGYGLLTGGHQVWEETREEDGANWSEFVTTEWTEAWHVERQGGTHLYSRPAGDKIHDEESANQMIFMADYGNGWLHVKEPDSLKSYYIRYEDCRLVKE